jgi:hypothetical protein
VRLSPTAARAVQAYGGERAWRTAERIDLVFSAGGPVFLLKGRPAFRSAYASVDVARPRTRLAPIDRAGNTGVLDGGAVRLESPGGEVLEERPDARSRFPRLTWDPLDMAYFFGYALWNYVTLPALLLRSDIAWREIDVGLLEARFPPELPTHGAVQRFSFDRETGLLARLDYTAEVLGSWARAAHLVLAHGRSGGTAFTSRRAAYVRVGGAPAVPVIRGEVHAFRMVSKET